jgi:hypothetical protein
MTIEWNVYRRILMPGLVPSIHVNNCNKKDVDGRDKPGHDGEKAAISRYQRFARRSLRTLP